MSLKDCTEIRPDRVPDLQKWPDDVEALKLGLLKLKLVLQLHELLKRESIAAYRDQPPDIAVLGLAYRLQKVNQPVSQLRGDSFILGSRRKGVNLGLPHRDNELGSISLIELCNLVLQRCQTRDVID